MKATIRKIAIVGAVLSLGVAANAQTGDSPRIIWGSLTSVQVMSKHITWNIEPDRKHITWNIEPDRKHITWNIEPDRKHITWNIEPDRKHITWNIEPDRKVIKLGELAGTVMGNPFVIANRRIIWGSLTDNDQPTPEGRRIIWGSLTDNDQPAPEGRRIIWGS